MKNINCAVLIVMKLLFTGAICILLVGCGEQGQPSEADSSIPEELSTENAEGTEVEDPYLSRIEELQAEIEALEAEYVERQDELTREEGRAFLNRRKELGEELREQINERRKFLMRNYAEEIPPGALDRAIENTLDHLDAANDEDRSGE